MQTYCWNSARDIISLDEFRISWIRFGAADLRGRREPLSMLLAFPLLSKIRFELQKKVNVFMFKINRG